MRILMWVRNPNTEIGGIERLVSQLTAALSARGHQIGFITDSLGNERSGHDLVNGMPAWRFATVDAMRRNDLAEVVAISAGINAAIDEFAPDVVHFHPSGPEAFMAVLARKKTQVPMLTTVHVDLKSILLPGRRSALLDALRSSAAVIAVSEFVAQQVHAAIPGLASVRVISNAVREHPTADVAPDSRTVFMLGRMVADKGFDLAIAAMPTILAEIPDAHLTIGGDGPERSNLELQARRLGVQPNIVFEGWIDPAEVVARMRQAAVIAMPSHWNEPFGLMALEAAWAGRPVVATRRGGLPEIVVDGETGILVSHEDPQDLAQAIIGLLKNPAEAERMGRAARARAVSCFSFEEFVEKHIALYEEVAG